ncbi:MAG: sigma-70 family RNA polymerase sigma factor [Clostridiales bacterium]|nr:sigma-70 family RNA polymerase sigma factor [Clostridiales bacterium]
MERLEDEVLVAKTLEGNKEAFSVLVQRYQKQIYSLAYRLCGDYDGARDLAQDSFLKIYEALGTFDRSRRFFPWMYRVAHNVCINILSKKQQELVPLDNIIDYEPSSPDAQTQPEVSFEQKERQRLISKALSELPEQFRIPLALKYIEGFSYKEISEHLQLPESTIETRLFRGRKMMQKKLEIALKVN